LRYFFFLLSKSLTLSETNVNIIFVSYNSVITT